MNEQETITVEVLSEVPPVTPEPDEVEITDMEELDYIIQLNKLEGEIKANNVLSVKHGKLTLQYAIEAGKLLEEIFDKMPYGQWNKFIKKTTIHPRTAINYRTLAKHVSELDECEGLREAYIKCGVIKSKPVKDKQGATGAGEETPKERTPEMIQHIEPDKYKELLTKAKKEIESWAKVQIGERDGFYNLNNWIITNDIPNSGGPNYWHPMVKRLAGLVYDRKFTTITHEHEIQLKAQSLFHCLTRKIMEETLNQRPVVPLIQIPEAVPA